MGSQLSRFYRLTNQGPENTCVKEIEGTSRSSYPLHSFFFSGTHLLNNPSVLGPGWGLRYKEDAWPGGCGVQRPHGTEALVSPAWDFRGPCRSERPSFSHPLYSTYLPTWNIDSETQLESHPCHTPSMWPSYLNSLSLTNFYEMGILRIPTWYNLFVCIEGVGGAWKRLAGPIAGAP